MVLRPLIPLTFLALLSFSRVNSADLIQQSALLSDRLSSSDEVSSILNSNEITCRKAKQSIRQLCHTLKLKDLVKLASLITTCIESSMNKHEEFRSLQPSKWDDTCGLRKASRAHINTLLSVSLPYLKPLCENRTNRLTYLLANNSLQNEETISRSSSNIMNTAAILTDCKPIEELSTFKQNFIEFGSFLDGMIPYFRKSSEASKAHQRDFDMFTRKMRRKFRYFQNQIESQIGEVEDLMNMTKSAYHRHLRLLAGMQLYVDNLGKLVHSESHLIRLRFEMVSNNRACTIAYYEWLARRGMTPQKCFSLKTKYGWNEKYEIQKHRKKFEELAMVQVSRKCKCQTRDQLLVLFLSARRLLSVWAVGWIDLDAHNSAGKRRSLEKRVDQLRREMNCSAKCFWIHNGGMVVLCIAVVGAYLHALRRIRSGRDEMDACADELRAMTAQRSQLDAIARRVNEVMAMCEFCDDVARWCRVVCKEVERTMESARNKTFAKSTTNN